MATRWTRVGVAILLVIAAGAMLRQFAAKRDHPAVAAARAPAKQRLNSELISAIRQGSAESVRQRLLRGADPNARVAPNGATALMLAVHLGHEKLATMLLDRGADPNARGQIVIPEGVDLDQLDLEHQVTPLIEAVWTLNAPVARLLLDRGADPNATDSDGLTAMNWAQNLIPTTDPVTSAPRMRRLDPILELLRSRGSRTRLVQ